MTPHMKLILCHLNDENYSRSLGNALKHVYNCPDFCGMSYHSTFQNIVQYLNSDTEYQPKKLSPYVTASNNEVVANVRQFFYNWMGPLIEAKLFVEACHKLWTTKSVGHKPVFLTDAVVTFDEYVKLQQAFTIVNVFETPDICEESAFPRKHYIRKSNEADLSRFICETASWVVNKHEHDQGIAG